MKPFAVETKQPRWRRKSKYMNTYLVKKIIFTIETFKFDGVKDRFWIDFDAEQCEKYGKKPGLKSAMGFRRSILETFMGRSQNGSRSLGWIKRQGLEKKWTATTDIVEGVPRLYFIYTPITRVMTAKGEHKTAV